MKPKKLTQSRDDAGAREEDLESRLRLARIFLPCVLAPLHLCDKSLLLSAFLTTDWRASPATEIDQERRGFNTKHPARASPATQTSQERSQNEPRISQMARIGLFIRVLRVIRGCISSIEIFAARRESEYYEKRTRRGRETRSRPTDCLVFLSWLSCVSC
jgi:hypothetical protein